jgi:hypothetical protein
MNGPGATEKLGWQMTITMPETHRSTGDQMPKTKFQQAQLMLQTMELGASLGLSDAMSWIQSDKFIPQFERFIQEYPRGSEGFRKASIVCTIYESLGTLWKHELISSELLFDWIAVSLLWDRLCGFALGMREATKNQRMYENFEAIAKANLEYDAKLAKRIAKKQRGRKQKQESAPGA